MPERRRSRAQWQRRLVLALLLAPALLWLVALIVLPHVDLALLSFRERVAPRAVRRRAWRSTRPSSPSRCTGMCSCAPRFMSVLATVLTLLLAFPIAWIIAKLARGRAGSLLFIVCLIPFWVSETVRTLGWMILLRESGVLPALLVQARDQPRCRSSCCITTRPSWWAWSTPRCSSWWCRWSQPGEPGQLPDRGGLRSGRQRAGRSCAPS